MDPKRKLNTTTCAKLTNQTKKKKEDVVRKDAATITDVATASFEPMDMFDLGMDDSNDDEGGDNKSGDKDGKDINAEGGDKELNARINDDMTTLLMKKGKNKDVIKKYSARITDAATVSFEPMDMFDLGVESNDDEGGDNESVDKDGEEIIAKGGDKEQHAGMNDDKTTTLMKNNKILQQANSNLEVECGGLKLVV
ncbi:hypothetical protein U1Q18_046813 [Sarracenia purpurea var. burkii]